MSELWVIGNGFDLWHGLPTSYSNFYQFAKTALDELEAYYVPGPENSGPWSDFENSLATFRCSEFYDAHDHIDIDSDNFRPSFVYGLEDDLSEQAELLVEAIRENFREWIEGIDISRAVGHRLTIPDDALFISFNYTSTLEQIYGIAAERILYLHGNAKNYDDLIFGHGQSMKEEPELDENGDSNRTMFSDAEGAAKYPFYALQKPVYDVLDKNRGFFDTLEHITKITVFGHSLNFIDLPYFRKLAVSAPNAHWSIICHADSEKEHHLKKLVSCEVPRDRVRVFSCANLQS